MRKVIHTLERLAALGLRPRPAAGAATPPGQRAAGARLRRRPAPTDPTDPRSPTSG
jgi:hypothetical protein